MSDSAYKAFGVRQVFQIVFFVVSVLSTGYIFSKVGVLQCHYEENGWFRPGVNISDLTSIRLAQSTATRPVATRKVSAISRVDATHWVLDVASPMQRQEIAEPNAQASTNKRYAVRVGVKLAVSAFLAATVRENNSFEPKGNETYGFGDTPIDVLEIYFKSGSIQRFAVGKVQGDRVYLRGISDNRIDDESLIILAPARLIRDLRFPVTKLAKQSLLSGRPEQISKVSMRCEQDSDRQGDAHIVFKETINLDEPVDDAIAMQSVVNILYSRHAWSFVTEQSDMAKAHHSAFYSDKREQPCEIYKLDLIDRAGRRQGLIYRAAKQATKQKPKISATVRHPDFVTETGDSRLIVPEHISELVDRMLSRIALSG